MLSQCLLRSFCSLNWQGRNQRCYPYFRGMSFGQKIKQFALGIPAEQLMSREYLTDPLNQTPQAHKLLFLKLFNHLAMHYKLKVIGWGEENEWRAREAISSISASCLHTAKEREKACPIFDFQIIVYDFPLFFQEHLSFFTSLLPSSFPAPFLYMVHSQLRSNSMFLKKATC